MSTPTSTVQPIFDIYMKLGGFYYKSGQKIPSNMGGIAPKVYQDMFQPFLNDIPARSPGDIREVVEGELGCPREDVFENWEDKPIGCASIGQVHRATLKETGQRVVVKVQNPEAERTFNGDVFALKTVVDLFMPQLSVAFDEIQRQFATEFDYLGEMKNAIDVRENLQRAGFKNIIVPKVYKKYSSKRLMVMEEVYPSIPLHDALDEQAEKMAKKKGITKEEFIDQEKTKMEKLAKELAKEGKLMKSHSSSTLEVYIGLQKLKRVVFPVYGRLYNWTIGNVFGKKYDFKKVDDIIVPLNAAKLIDDLLTVHGHETLVDGCFNADPHPGNVLCAQGKLALIDYGQVKRISKKNRLDLSKLIVLVEKAIEVDPRVNPSVDMRVHKNAKRSVANHARGMGMKTEKMLDDSIYEMCAVYFGRMDAAFLYPRNVIQWTDWMESRDPIGNIDEIDFLVMVNNSSMMLRGLGEMLQQYRNLAVSWGPIARKVLAKEGLLKDVESEIDKW